MDDLVEFEVWLLEIYGKEQYVMLVMHNETDTTISWKPMAEFISEADQ